MRFDRTKFFDQYRRELGRLGQSQVDGLNELLSFMENDLYLTDLRHAAYMLATVKHETANTYHPVHEYGTRNYFIKRYGGHTKKGKELGNDTPEEGFDYAGKGYPQTTGESNYEKAENAIRKYYPETVANFEARTGRRFDLTVGDQPNDKQDPQNMLDPAISYVTMSYGMRSGMFTGHKLIDHINDIQKNYRGARKIINGNDKAALLAQYAYSFENILRRSKISSTPVPESATVSRSSTRPGSVSGDLGGQSATSVSGSPIVSADKEDQSSSIRAQAATYLAAAKDWSLGPGMPVIKQLTARAVAGLALIGSYLYANWQIFLLVIVILVAFVGVKAYRGRRLK